MLLLGRWTRSLHLSKGRPCSFERRCSPSLSVFSDDLSVSTQTYLFLPATRMLPDWSEVE